MTAAVFFKSLKKPTKPCEPEMKTRGDGSPFAGLMAILKDHKPMTLKFGPDKVKPGHDVTFKAGSFVGSGKVSAAGKHGCTVEDCDARSHEVHWHEVTGHTEPDAKPKKGDEK